MTVPPAARRISDPGLFWLVVLLGVACRTLLFFWFGEPFRHVLAAGSHSDAYRLALGAHFWEYLNYSHTVPPLTVVRDWLVQALLGADNARIGVVVMMAAGDCLAGGLTVLIARRAGTGQGIAAFAGILVSCRLAMWEAARPGVDWDTFNPLLIALFVWALLRFWQTPTVGRALGAGVAGATQVLGFSFGVPLVLPASVAAAVLLGLRAASWRRGCSAAVLLLALPVLTTAAVVTKNGLEHGLWSMSSGAGQNILQAYNSGLKDPADRDRGAYVLGERNGYPDWWQWCYIEAERRALHPVRPLPSWYGMCIYRLGADRQLVLDYAGLRDYLERHPDPAIEAVVRKDLSILRDKPWLWSGDVFTRTTGVGIAYGKISQRIMLDTLFAQPDYFINRAWRTFTSHWLGNGAKAYVTRNRAPYDEPLPLWLVNLIGVPLFYVGALLALYHFFRSGWRFVRRLRSLTPEVLLAGTTPENLLLSVCVVGPLFASVLLACCENYRHALVLIPVLMVLALEAVRRRSFWQAWRRFLIGLGRRLRLYRPAVER